MPAAGSARRSPLLIRIFFGGVLTAGAVVAVYFLIMRYSVPMPAGLDDLSPALAEEIRAKAAEVRRDPSNPEKHGALGLLYQTRGMTDIALQCYNSAVAAAPSQPRWRYLWATAAVESGLVEQAEQAFRTVIAQKPDYPPAHQQLGDLLLDRNDSDGAAGCFRRLTQLRPDRPHGYIGQAKARIAAQEHSEAIEILDKVLARNPDYHEAHRLLGEAYQSLGKTDEAQREFAMGESSDLLALEDPWSIGLEADRVAIMSRLDPATRLVDAGRLDEAILEFEALLAEMPRDTAVLNNLSVAYLMVNRVDDAFRVLTRALELDPDDPATYMNLAMTLRAMGDFEAALIHVQRSVELAPWIGGVLRTKGAVLTDLGRFKDALKAYRRAERLEPNHGDVQGRIGETLAKMRRWDEAIDAFEKAVVVAPQSGEWHVHLGAAYLEVGRLDDGIKTLRKASSLEPDNPRILQILETAEARGGTP